MMMSAGSKRARDVPKSHRRFTFPLLLFLDKSQPCVTAEKGGGKSSQ